MTDHLEERGQEAKIHGIAPNRSIDMTTYSGSKIPDDWEITGVTGDILMVEYADATADGEYINRKGILINQDVSQHVWRVGIRLFCQHYPPTVTSVIGGCGQFVVDCFPPSCPPF